MFYILYGKDDYLINSQIKKIEKLTTETFDFLTDNLVNFINAVKQPIFIDPKKNIILKNCSFLETAKPDKNLKLKLEKLIMEPTDHNVFFITNSDKISKSSPLVMKMSEVAKSFNIPMLSMEQQKKLVKKFSVDKGMEITEEAIDYLVINSKYTFELIKNLKTLALSKEKIDQKNIKKIVEPIKEFVGFDLTKKLFSGQANEVFEIIEKLRMDGEQDIAIVALITSILRNVQLIKIGSNINDQEFLHLTKMHPYAKKVNKEIAFKIKMDELIKIQSDLFDIENKIKSGVHTNSSLLDIKLCEICEVINNV